MNALNHPRIVIDSAVCGGQPAVRGTHFAVADIMRLLADGDTEESLAADFPPLTVADIRACRAFWGDRPLEPDWIDKLGGSVDADFAAAALDRPGPDSYERPDIRFD